MGKSDMKRTLQIGWYRTGALFAMLGMILIVACQPPPAPSSTRVDRKELVVDQTAPPVEAPATIAPPPSFPGAPVDVGFTSPDGRALMVALPPLMTSASLAASATAPVPLPMVMMLHGVCGGPVGGCQALGAAGRDDSWLVCPGGNVRCGDNYNWKGAGERKAKHLDAAALAMRARYPELVAPPGQDVLVGFSRGAFVARDVAYARPGRYKGLVLIGAALKPDPKRLLESGVRRVVLASGDFDGARPTMVKATAKLILGGVEARFVSTGRIYHQLPSDIAEVLAPHIAWVRSAPPAPEATATASI